jgi:hypothetical protein
MFILRLLIALEIFSCFVLFYFTFDLGSPIPYPYSGYAIPYGTSNSNSWVFGFARAITGIVVIGIGIFGDMHPAPRFFCMLGGMLQVYCDCVSSILMEDYLDQSLQKSASLGKYNATTFRIYMYRDFSSLAINIWIILLCSHLSNIVGWCEPQ